MFVLLLIAVPLVEVLALIEVGEAIGWLPALLLLIGTSLLGVQLLRVQGRAAIDRLALARAGSRPSADGAIDGALAFLGAALLAVPGFVSDAFGLLLLAKPTRALARRRLSRHYAARLMRFLARTGRFGAGAGTGARTRARPPADVDSTAIDDDFDQLGR
ncbi:MAG TPA: FxsA family protein [Solirubrobacteraceae bacterium]|jgi:UPF0716 protein FxsA|nr:FxsA family protein [Solirubrobacteraceae bacterium]